MKYSLFLLLCLSVMYAHAASIDISHITNSHGEILVSVSLDPEGESINSVEGTISFPKEYVEVTSVSTTDSVVPLWLERPKVLTSIDLSGLSHIHFEGAIPGGFNGVRSAYYNGSKSGTLFSITLKSLKEGEILALLDGATLYLNDGNATALHVDTTTYPIAITSVTQAIAKPDQLYVENQSLKPYIAKSELVADGKWALIIQNDETQHGVDHYEVAESKEFFPEKVASYEWKKTESPYILKSQKRNVFVHVKALYADGTYTITTLPPVENIDSTSDTSSILIFISIVLLALYAIRKYFGKGKHR